MYHEKKFRIRSVDDIKVDLDTALSYYGPGAIQSVFLADGNTIIMRTEQLVEILNYARRLFPGIQRVTTYGASQYLNLKSLEDFKALKAAGLSRIHCGMESGYDPVLKMIRKGATADVHISAGQKVMESGIELSMYYLVGVGGLEMSREHALGSARVLNAVNPDFIRIRTFVPHEDSTMLQWYLSGEFKLLEPHDALKELRIFVENLDVDCFFLSDHSYNFLNVQGKLPKDKEHMLAHIDYALSLSRDHFRELFIGTTG
jgi:radical SAM superfamily enzyme YgiQ (UPF0313 family)